MAPQREGSEEEDNDVRPKLATTLQGGDRGLALGRGRTEVAETACVKRSPYEEITESGGGEGQLGGAMEGGVAAAGVDDELTNLTWLQNCNLLQGIHRQVSNGGLGEPNENNRQPPSPSSAIAKGIINNNNNNNKTSNSVGTEEFYNPTVHRHAKPPYSFSCLIFMAIEDSPSKALPVKDIYNWIFSHFPYFRNAPNGWRNSIRHNLSLSKCFYKVDKGQNIAKGSLWCVDPKYRHHLLHSLNKTPNAHYHQGIRLPTYNSVPLPNSLITTAASAATIAAVINDQDNLRREQEDIMTGTSPSSNPGPNPKLFPYLSKRLAVSNTKNQEEDAAATMLALKNGSALDYVKQKKLKTSARMHKEPAATLKIGNHPDVYRTNLNEGNLSRTKDDPRVTCRFLLPLSLCVPIPTSRPSKDHTYSTAGESDEEDEEGDSDEQPLELTTKSRTQPDSGQLKEKAKNVSDNKWRRREMDSVIVISSSTVRDELRRRKKLHSDSVAEDDEEEEEIRGKYLRRKKNETKAAEVLDEEQKIVEGADALLNLAGIVTAGSVGSKMTNETDERPTRRQRKPNRRNLRHLVR